MHLPKTINDNLFSRSFAIAHKTSETKKKCTQNQIACSGCGSIKRTNEQPPVQNMYTLYENGIINELCHIIITDNKFLNRPSAHGCEITSKPKKKNENRTFYKPTELFVKSKKKKCVQLFIGRSVPSFRQPTLQFRNFIFFGWLCGYCAKCECGNMSLS